MTVIASQYIAMRIINFATQKLSGKIYHLVQETVTNNFSFTSFQRNFKEHLSVPFLSSYLITEESTQKFLFNIFKENINNHVYKLLASYAIQSKVSILFFLFEKKIVKFEFYG